MKKIDYFLLVITCLATSFPIYASAQINLGFGVTPFATTKITGSKLAMTSYNDNRLSTGNYKNFHALQFFVSYDKDLMSFFGFRVGASSKTIQKRTDSKYTYDRNDGNFIFNISAFMVEFDLKFKFRELYLTVGFNQPMSYTIHDNAHRQEEGEMGLQGALGLIVYETWGFEFFYSELKGKLIHKTSDATQTEAFFTTPLLGFSMYYSISL